MTELLSNEGRVDDPDGPFSKARELQNAILRDRAEMTPASEYYTEIADRINLMAKEKGSRPSEQVVRLINQIDSYAIDATEGETIAFEPSASHRESEMRDIFRAALIGAGRLCIDGDRHQGEGKLPFYDAKDLTPNQMRDLQRQLEFIFVDLTDGTSKIPGVELGYIHPDDRSPNHWQPALTFERGYVATESQPVLRAAEPVAETRAQPTADFDLTNYMDTTDQPALIHTDNPAAARPQEQSRHHRARGRHRAQPHPAAAETSDSLPVTQQQAPEAKSPGSDGRTLAAHIYDEMDRRFAQMYSDYNKGDLTALNGFRSLLQMRQRDILSYQQPDEEFAEWGDKDRKGRTVALAVNDALHETGDFISPVGAAPLRDEQVIFSGWPADKVSEAAKSELAHAFRVDMTKAVTREGLLGSEVPNASTFVEIDRLPGTYLRLDTLTYSEDATNKYRDEHKGQDPDGLQIVLTHKIPEPRGKGAHRRS